MKYPKAIIDIDAIINNISVIREKVKERKILAIVKANAYGHGLVNVANAIDHYVDGFGVARVHEAELLRTAGIEKRIVLLEGFMRTIELLRASELKLDIVVHCYDQLYLIEQYREHISNLSVWIKFNTGMNRLGFDQAEVEDVKARLSKIDCVKEIHMMTHLSRAENSREDSFTQGQLSKFAQVDKTQSSNSSVCASSGILFYPEDTYDWVRPGIIMYGISPNYDSIESQGFKPVMTLETMLISVHKRVPGDTIGYGNNYTVEKDTYVGVVAMGYGDGYPRDIVPGTPVLINGRRVPIIGKVSMDMLTVDLGPEKIDKVGDQVIMFGKGLPVEEISKYNNIITYELTTRITERVEHEFRKKH